MEYASLHAFWNQAYQIPRNLKYSSEDGGMENFDRKPRSARSVACENVLGKMETLNFIEYAATSAKPNKFRTLGVFVFDLRYSWDGFWLILSSRICLRKSCFLLNSWILVCLTYMKKYPRNSLEVGKTAGRACRSCITLFIEVYGFGLSLNIDL